MINKLVVISWNFPFGYRHFAKSEIDALYNKGIKFRLISSDYRIYDKQGKYKYGKDYFLIRVFRKIIDIANKLLPFINKKYFEEYLFDLYASNHISKSEYLYADKNNFPFSFQKAKKKGAKIIVYQPMAHFSYLEQLIEEEQSTNNYKSKYLNNRLNKRRKDGLLIADYIFAHSKIVKYSDHIFGLSKKDIRIIYGCVDLETYYYKDKLPDLFTCLFVGHETLKKGIVYLIEAWNSLNLKHSQLLIAGLLDIQLAKQFNANSNIKFLGSVSNIIDLYHNSSVFVHPALIDAGPKVVTEAMASGLPVIVTDRVGYSEIITDGEEGFIVPIRDSNALAEKILYFYNHQDKIKIMGKKARLKAEQFSTEKHGEEVSRQLQKIMNS